MKVKSHSMCMLNEQADELAGLGNASEEPTLCPGPNKYGREEGGGRREYSDRWPQAIMEDNLASVVFRRNRGE
jgi:hypothetical protein